METLPQFSAPWLDHYRTATPKREREPYQRPEPFIGRLLLIVPGFTLDWTLRQDMRDLRRFYAIDLDGNRQDHAAPKELVRNVALLVPRYRRHDD